MSDYEPGESVASVLGNFANFYWNNYLTYWEMLNANDPGDLTPKQREFIRNLDHLGKKLRGSLHTLEVNSEVIGALQTLFGTNPEAQLDYTTAAKFLAGHTVVKDCININLGFEATDSLLHNAEIRAPILLQLLEERRLSNRARAFLDRATRLFLWGFDPETIIMCHAVLDAALESVLTDEQLWAKGFPKKGKWYSSDDRIKGAVAVGLLKPEDGLRAQWLRNLRNSSIHSVPNSDGEAEKALKTLAHLLEVLFPKAHS
jgi:hypothetical protein